jgi:hypothetical protein
LEYIEKNLMEGEVIIGKAREHFSSGVYMIVIGMAYCVWTLLSSDVDLPSSGEVYKFLAVVFAFAIVWAYFLHIKTQFVVTDRRVLALQYDKGMRLTKLDLNQLKDLRIDWGILGKKMDYGTIIITCVDGSKVYLSDVSRPQFFKDMVLEVQGYREHRKLPEPKLDS